MNKMVIAGGVVITLIVISMAYGASMNPGGNEKRSGGEIWNFRISGQEFHDINNQDWVTSIRRRNLQNWICAYGRFSLKKSDYDNRWSEWTENQKYYLDDPVKTVRFL